MNYRAFLIFQLLQLYIANLFKEQSIVSDKTSHLTNVFIIRIGTWIATSLRRTPDNIAIPCSVNIYGLYLLPPLPFEVAICDLKSILLPITYTA